jgi:hypothetical protein
VGRVRTAWQRVSDALEQLRALISDFTRREGFEFAFGVVLLALGVAIWRYLSNELGFAVGIALVVPGVIACAHALMTFTVERRREAAQARDVFERELAEMRRIAELARSILLEIELWSDVDAMQAYIDGQRANPGREIPPPPSWTVGAILKRGRGGVEPLKVRGWSTIAQLLRDHAAHLTNLIDQQFPGQPAERRADLKSVFRANEKAAEAADALAAARQRVIELAGGVSAEVRHRAEDALKDSADEFFGALQWMEGAIEQIERAEGMRREIEEVS